MSSTRVADAAADAVLVTGASGFVGSHVVARLDELGHPVVVTRRPGRLGSECRRSIEFDLDDPRSLAPHALARVGVVVHSAARVHVMQPSDADASAFRRQNVDATLHLATVARAAGVRRFVFVSSIKVNGDRTAGEPFRASDQPAPGDAYARSKLAAEEGLWDIAAKSGLEVVVVRPPLVYGDGVGGNFRRMLQWVDRAVPLPFARVGNVRSVVSVWNLADLLVCASAHPAAAGRTLLVADDFPLSTPALLQRVAAAMDRRIRLFPAPIPLLRAAATMLGRSEEFERLCGSLAVDDRATREALDWAPPLTQDEALRRTAAWFVSEVVARRA